MNNTLKIVLIVLAVLFGAALLLAGGVVIGRNFLGRAAYMDGRFPFNPMDNFNNRYSPDGRGPGMMGRGYYPQDDSRRSFGMGPGMMGRGFNPQGEYRQPFGMGPGMMGNRFSNYTGEPLSIEEVKTSVEAYLAQLGNDDLVLKELMIFNQNAYAVIQEESTGISAMELLVDHASGDVFPEYGPNMMWNLKYGMMGGRRGEFGSGACCSDVYSADGNFEFEAMPVTLEKARAAAQEYLDQAVPGATITDEVFIFYGYYTFDFEENGEMAGMLSVNGFSSDVWPHTWHGDFVAEQEIN